MANTTSLPIDTSSARERKTNLASDREVLRDRSADGEPPRDSLQPRAASRIERIARRAHEIYEERGGEHGRALEDWLQAERDIDADSTERG
jgi:hypothetical protein